MAVAVILSGGSGVRLGGDIPKQYLKVGGKPVIAGHGDGETVLALERFIADVAGRDPLSVTEGEGYTEGAVYEGEGRLYTSLAAVFSGGEGTADALIGAGQRKPDVPFS